MDLQEIYDLDLNLSYEFALLVLLIPFIEELIFRLPLRRIGVSKRLFSENTWNKYYRWFFYSFALAFGFVHITNFEINSVYVVLLAPIITLSQIIGGFIMSYLRIRFNFWMGFLRLLLL